MFFLCVAWCNSYFTKLHKEPQSFPKKMTLLIDED